MLSISKAVPGKSFAPLEKLTVVGDGRGDWIIKDGLGQIYCRRSGIVPFTFTVAGALGRHEVARLDTQGRVADTVSFHVDCRTEIKDRGGAFRQLLADAHWTMATWTEGYARLRLKSRSYHFFSICCRDNTHLVKGFKYFDPSAREAVDLNAEAQRPDGMIWDTIKKPQPFPDYWQMIFGPPGFFKRIGPEQLLLHRTPVEADLEYLFVEALYDAWKASGDDAWMTSRLDNAIRAIRFATTSPYYWSKKYQLIRRGYTIDTWDYQTIEDKRRTGHSMLVDLKKTRFGVMHGDNTGLAQSCRYLAEMLARAGRKDEARQYARLSTKVMERLNRIAWNGRFYRHHVPEDATVKRDLGVDESKQVSLSNAYALNRGLTHKQCVSIIKTYQRIRREMPAGSPGEFYMIYPPFERGFGHAHGQWEYMNGGVSTIVAGELAHGAFEHGFEQYGADILRRVGAIAQRYRGYMHCVLRGAPVNAPRRQFETLNLRAVANADFRCPTVPGVIGWTGEPDNDLARMPTGRRTFHGIPFEVIVPRTNGHRACLGLSTKAPYARQATVTVRRKAASIYLLHTAGPNVSPAGFLIAHYADGAQVTLPVDSTKVGHWWTPGDWDKQPEVWPQCDRLRPEARIAWRGPNKTCPDVAVFVAGFTNPCPDKEIAALEFQTAPNGQPWLVLGATLCDAPVFFDPGEISHGIPDHWGAAAVTYAIVEGLAGVKDTGVAFDRALIAPRWAAAGVTQADVTIRYAASDGYVRYRYKRSGKTIAVDYTCNAEHGEVQLLLPTGAKIKKVTLDGQESRVRCSRVESSSYLCMAIDGVGVHRLRVSLA